MLSSGVKMTENIIFSSFYHVLFINKPTTILIPYKLSRYYICKLSILIQVF